MVLPVIAAILLSSCTSTVSSIDTTAASIQPQMAGIASVDGAASGQSPAPADQNATTLAMTNGATPPTGDPSSPGAAPAQILVGSRPANDPSFALAATEQTAITAAAAGTAPQEAKPDGQVELAMAQQQPVAETAAASVDAARFGGPEPTSQQVQLASVAASATAPVQELTSAPPAQQFLDAAPQPPVKKPRKTLFAAMFGDTKQKPAAKQATPEPLPAETQLALASPTPKSAALASAAAAELETPQLKLTDASLESPEPRSAPSVDNGDLPGVRKGALFEIKRRDSLDSDADVDIGETDDGPILLASAAGLGRLAPNGLKVQRDSVDVACIKPQLVRMLKKLESHYGRNVVVTSGYRSPGYNRRVRGAKNSLHMYCAAVDIQIAGVGKWELAKYARSMPGRGGVGTYCHTNSVHIDIGPDRDWNWRCSRRK